MICERERQVEQYLTAQADGIDRLAAIFQTHFDLPREAVWDTVRRRLLMDLADGRDDLLSATGKRGVRGCAKALIAAVWMTLQAIRALLFHRHVQRQDQDMLLDHWGADNFAWYQRILAHLPACRISIFSRTASARHFPDYPLIHRPFGKPFHGKVAQRLLRALPAVIMLLSGSGHLNICLLGMVLLKKVGDYASDVAGLRARVFLSSGDNYFSAFRYYLYKAGGIGTVALLQNGVRGSAAADSYLYADLYFVHGMATAQVIPGLHCPEIHAIGAIPSWSSLQMARDDVGDALDVVFIEQMVIQDIPDSCSQWAYAAALDNLVAFAREFSDYKICYAVRPNRQGRKGAAENDARISGTPVIRSDQLGITSYQALARGAVVVTYNSTMGFEAAGLGKPFLFCNYDALPLLPDDDGVGVLQDSSYPVFRQRLLRLLQPDQDLADYVEIFRQQHMMLAEDPAKTVADRLTPLVSVMHDFRASGEE